MRLKSRRRGYNHTQSAFADTLDAAARCAPAKLSLDGIVSHIAPGAAACKKSAQADCAAL